MFGWLIAFMRMRSPSSAPPVRFREGSTAMTAIFRASFWSRRKRRISSSVSELLPEPPVPVMPSVGTAIFAARCIRSWRSFSGTASFSSAVMRRASWGRSAAPAASAEDLDVGAAALAQQVDHVLEEFDVAALIGRNGDALHVFLQRGGDDVLDGTVVAEVDHLAAGGLEDAPHDVDRRIM